MFKLFNRRKQLELEIKILKDEINQLDELITSLRNTNKKLRLMIKKRKGEK